LPGTATSLEEIPNFGNPLKEMNQPLNPEWDYFKKSSEIEIKPQKLEELQQEYKALNPKFSPTIVR
jgi:hypothetical protein